MKIEIKKVKNLFSSKAEMKNKEQNKASPEIKSDSDCEYFSSEKNDLNKNKNIDSLMKAIGKNQDK